MNWKEEFMELMFPSDPKSINRNKAISLKQKHIPKSIFKYREINKNSLTNLKNNTIWLTGKDSLNDPNECRMFIDREILTKCTRKNQIIKSKQLLTQFFKIDEDAYNFIIESSDPYNQFFNYIEKSYSKNKFNEQKLKFDRSITKIIADNKKSISEGFKLCSFSERKDSILMWSHYANNHKGFCIEYELVNISPPNHRRYSLYPVTYSDEIFDATNYYCDYSKNNTPNYTYLVQAGLYKAKDWKYEEEWRLLFPFDMIQNDQPFEMGKPKAIYLGSEFDYKDESGLLDICKEKNIPIFKMEQHKSKFQLYNLELNINDCLEQKRKLNSTKSNGIKYILKNLKQFFNYITFSV